MLVWGTSILHSYDRNTPFPSHCNVFRRFKPAFTGRSASLNKKKRSDQPHTFDKSTSGKIASLEMLNSRQMKPVSAFWKTTMKPTYRYKTSRLDGPFCRFPPTEPTNQLDFGHICLTTPSSKWNHTWRLYHCAVGSTLALILFRSMSTYHQERTGFIEWKLTLKDSTGRLARRWQHLSECKFDTNSKACVNHQPAGPRWLLNTPGRDQTPINEKFQWSASLPFPSAKRRGYS